MISNTIRPKTQHSPKWDKDAEEIREKEHAFRSDFETLLEIPVPERRRNGAYGLRYAKVCQLEEGEVDEVVLDDRY